MPSFVSYQFGDFELDLAVFELRHRGGTVKLAPRAFSLLQYLLEHHDRVVLKEELLEQVWPDTVVTSSVVHTSIRRIRSALGQSGREGTPIQTLHGRGYRLNMPVKRVARPCSQRGLTNSEAVSSFHG